jgi:acetyl-CoA synthetase
MSRITSFTDYEKQYKKSIENPEDFWAEQANEFVWKKNGIPYWNGISKTRK